MPLKVCHVLTRLILGGADENTLLTASHADREAFDVSLAYGAECEEVHLRTAHEHGVKTRQFPRLINRPAPILDWMVIRDMAAWMRDERFGIVHTHQTKGGFVGRVAAHQAGVPIIIHTVHGWGFGSLDMWWLNAVLRNLERFTARWCDAIFFVCDNLRRQAVEMEIGRPEIFKTVYSGIVLDRYIEPSRHRARPAASPVVVATITRLAPGKGVEAFVAGAAHVAERLPDVRFWIVGDGPSREELAAEVARRGLQDRIELLGRRSDVPQLLAEVDVVVRMIDQEAVYREGIPRTLIEAMAAGKAVIGADLGGIPEIIDADVNGLLVAPDDAQALSEAMLRLCSDAQLRRRLGVAAANSVGERFDHRTMVREIEAEYLRMATEKGLLGNTNREVPYGHPDA